MKNYIRGQFTITTASANGFTSSNVTSILAQLKPGAIIDDMPVLPKVVKKTLDEILAYADLIEMSITTDDGPIPIRRVGIYYSTKMPWEDQ